MIKRVYNLLLFILLIGLILLYPKVTLAQSACTSLSGCTREQSIPVSFPNLGCSGTRTYYNCAGTTCYQDSATCTTKQAVCNASPSTGDNYNCVKFCTDLKNTPGNCCADGTPVSQCGDPPAEHCTDYYNVCVNSYCDGAGGGLNYTCPSPQECISPPDAKAHQCVTPVACTYPDPSTVACGTTVSPTNGPSCSSPQTLTGTYCPANQTCSNGFCYPPCPIGPATGGITYSCQAGSSCPGGYYSSGLYTCSAGNTCCWTSTIKYKCSGTSCVGDNGDGTGTFTENSCGNTCSGATPGTGATPAPGVGSCNVVSAQAVDSTSGRAVVLSSGFDRIVSYLNGINAGYH
ncbi:hypothetical protein HYW41_04905, partial [Candidatus Daviesbacteria bacterium]|nr:hypothetical protein [Candidatus Daviesbacteria bacterium]